MTDYPAIEDIDFSGGFQSFVVEFNLTRSLGRSIPPSQRPVRLPEKIHERKPATGISVAVSSVYIDYSMPSGYLSRLTCEGFISPQWPSKQNHLKGSACSIEFTQYSQDDGSYPKESLSGTFTWHKDTRSFSVELNYRGLDLSGPLAPLLSFGANNNWMNIGMTLLADLADSKLGDDQHGEISYWSVKLSQVKRAKLVHKMEVLREIASATFATVFSSSFGLFLYIVGLRGYAIAAALVLSPFAYVIINRKLNRIWNKDNSP